MLTKAWFYTSLPWFINLLSELNLTFRLVEVMFSELCFNFFCFRVTLGPNYIVIFHHPTRVVTTPRIKLHGEIVIEIVIEIETVVLGI